MLILKSQQLEFSQANNFSQIIESCVSYAIYIHYGYQLSVPVRLKHYADIISYRPRQANLVLIAYASSEGYQILNPRCSLIQAVSQEELSDRKPDPWSL